MVITEAYNNPIVINEAASILLLKNNVKKAKDKVQDILNGKLKIKNPQDEEELKEWILKNEDSLKKLNKALDVDVDELYKKKTALYSFFTTMALIIVSIILLPAAGTAGFIMSLITLLHSILVLIKTSDATVDISEATSAVKKVHRELSKVNINKIKNKEVREKYSKLMEEVEDTINNSYNPNNNN